MLKVISATALVLACNVSASAGNFLPDCPADTKFPTESVAWMVIPSDSGVAGELLGGTVWFIGKQQVIAVLHDHAEALTDWTEISLSTGNVLGQGPMNTKTTLARIKYIIDSGTDENLYVIELAEAFTDVEVPKVRFGAPFDQEPVFSLTYRDGVFAIATGRHVLPKQSTDPSTGEPPPPFLMFELADPAEKDRMVIDFGSSGSPVFDCEGQVVAAVTTVLTQELNVTTPMRVSTHWGAPNVFGVTTSVITKPFE